MTYKVESAIFQVRSGCLGSALLTAMMAVCTPASALQVNGTVGADLRYTDNAAFTPSNESSDTIFTTTLGGTVSEDQGAITGNATASLSYLDYLDNTFDNQTYLQLDAAAAWEQIANVLRWDVNDYFSQAAVNNLTADVPTNKEDINVFNLAAQFTMRPADRHTVTITPSFDDFYYETSDNDNQQVGVAAGWSYQLRPTVAVSLNGGVRDVSYDNNALGADHTVTSVSVGTTILRARSEYTASVGASKVDRDVGNDSDGLIASLAALYRLSAHSTLNANLSSDITDTSNVYLATSLDPNAGNFGNIQTSNDVLRNSLARLAYTRAGSSVNFSTWVELRKLDYKTTPNDRKVQEYGASLGYNLSPRLTASVLGTYIETEEQNLALTDRYYEAGGQLGYALSRKLSARAGIRFQNRDNTDSLRDYDEYSVFAGLGYRLGR